jgi:hypothetical protein
MKKEITMKKTILCCAVFFIFQNNILFAEEAQEKTGCKTYYADNRVCKTAVSIV